MIIVHFLCKIKYSETLYMKVYTYLEFVLTNIISLNYRIESI